MGLGPDNVTQIIGYTLLLLGTVITAVLARNNNRLKKVERNTSMYGDDDFKADMKSGQQILLETVEKLNEKVEEHQEQNVKHTKRLEERINKIEADREEKLKEWQAEKVDLAGTLGVIQGQLTTLLQRQFIPQQRGYNGTAQQG